MSTLETLTKILRACGDEARSHEARKPDSDDMERLVGGSSSTRPDAYAAVQREFGWDDTH